jgi:hypothetical protein
VGRTSVPVDAIGYAAKGRSPALVMRMSEFLQDRGWLTQASGHPIKCPELSAADLPKYLHKYPLKFTMSEAQRLFDSSQPQPTTIKVQLTGSGVAEAERIINNRFSLRRFLGNLWMYSAVVLFLIIVLLPRFFGDDLWTFWNQSLPAQLLGGVVATVVATTIVALISSQR